MEKAVVDVTIRIVVAGTETARAVEDGIDNFLERALHSNTDILTDGLVDAQHTNTTIIHKWEEIA
jgi:hypothetical protein